MPSYIELDKQALFPASSNVGKLILGVNSSGQATLTNSDGQTTSIGGGGSVNTGSLLTTSSFNAFTSSYNTGSFTGSFNGRFTGSLFGTSSWAENSLTASYITASNVFGPFGSSSIASASFAVSSSRAVTSSFATSASWAPNSGPISVTGSTLYSTSPAAGPGFGTLNQNSIFLGGNAGNQATTAQYSHFLGSNAGFEATDAYYSNFIGNNTGFRAASASLSTLIGSRVGYNWGGDVNSSIGSNNIIIGTNITLAAQQKDSINLGGIIFATGSYSNLVGAPLLGSVSNARVGIGTSTPAYTLDVSGSINFTNTLFQNGTPFSAGGPISVTGSTIYSNSPATSNVGTLDNILLGETAGQGAPNLTNSNFLGKNAGRTALNASNSNFFGQSAGLEATNAASSNFFGQSAGQQAVNASYSTLIGHKAGSAMPNPANSIGSNNIIIGTNITLPAQQKDSINLGGIIFATGSHSDQNAQYPLSGSMPNAKVGIGTSTPEYTLDVSGSTRINDILILQPRTTTPGTPTNGMVIVSGSGADQHIYCYLNNTWQRLNN